MVQPVLIHRGCAGNILNWCYIQRLSLTTFNHTGCYRGPDHIGSFDTNECLFMLRLIDNNCYCVDLTSKFFYWNFAAQFCHLIYHLNSLAQIWLFQCMFKSGPGLFNYLSSPVFPPYLHIILIAMTFSFGILCLYFYFFHAMSFLSFTYLFINWSNISDYI